MTECRDASHLACAHPGWREVPPGELAVAQLAMARAAVTRAVAELGLDPVRLVFFAPGPRHPVPTDGPALTMLARLNAGPYNPDQLGWAFHPETVQPLTIGILAGCSPAVTEWTARHECRHLWQMWTGASGADEEGDANRFARAAFADRPRALAAMADEGNFPADP